MLPGEAPVAFAKETRGKAGGRLRVGLKPVPTGTLEPWTYQETVALQLGGISGEFLNRNRPNLTLAPELAVSWKPNATGSEWTYKLRQGVKFANGKPMTADDVIATYKRLISDPTSQAASAFSGVLSEAGITKVDDFTISFKLDTPIGNFSYLTSSTTYQSIILPKDYAGPFEKTPQTTGAFNLVAYTPGVERQVRPQPQLVGRLGSARRHRLHARRRHGDHERAARRSGRPACRAPCTSRQPRAVQQPEHPALEGPGATHREIPMRIDDGVLKDKRVRQAIALTLDRPRIVKQFFNGLSDLGNDSPFAPVYPSTNESVPQRHKDIAKAKQLIAAAGLSKGWRRSSSPTRPASCPPWRRSSSSRSRRSAASSTSRS